jgi:hypothetical protein
LCEVFLYYISDPTNAHMNIQRLPENLIRWGVTIVGLLVALILAKAAGEGRTNLVVAALTLLGGVAVTLVLRERIFLAIPIFWGLTGRTPQLNVPLQIRDIIVLWIFVSFLMLVAFKIVRRRTKLETMDFFAWGAVLYLFTTWIRNPVGVEAFQSDRVGGRPYFDVFVAFLAYLVMSRSSFTIRSARSLPLAMTATRMFDGTVALGLVLVPALIPFVESFYYCNTFALVDGMAVVNPNRITPMESTERLGYLAFIGYPLAQYLAARYSLKELFSIARPWRLVFLLVSIVFILLSGFRSALFSTATVFLTAIAYREGLRGVVKLSLIGVVAVTFIAVANGTLFDLPRSAQRALSWLPGNWDEFSKQEAQGSTEWRTQMWKAMLTTNTYIDNHLLGDGFGFKRRDLERMVWQQMYGGGEDQESFMISGGVHSGPVSTIRYVGYVGLLLHLIILSLLARKAWQLCIRSRGGPFEVIVFLIGIPVVLEPVLFALIFGAYETSAPATFFVLGSLKFVENTLDDYDGQSKARTAETAVPLSTYTLPDANGIPAR